MDLRKVLSVDMISLDLPASDKNSAIEALLDILMTTGKVKDRREALTCLLDRERKMSTGLQHGIAIPHGKSDTVDELVACIALKKDGIDFQSLDGEKSTIFICTLSPANRSGPHVQFLAEVSQLLKEPESRERILNARSRQEVLEVIVG